MLKKGKEEYCVEVGKLELKWCRFPAEPDLLRIDAGQLHKVATKVMRLKRVGAAEVVVGAEAANLAVVPVQPVVLDAFEPRKYHSAWTLGLGLFCLQQ